MALKPQRWILSTLALALALVIFRAEERTVGGSAWLNLQAAAWARCWDETGLELGRGQVAAAAAAVARGVRAMSVDIPFSRPISTLAIVLPVLLLWGLAGTAVARMTAVEFGQGVQVPWPRALRFGVMRWRAAMAALLVGPAAAGVIAMALAIGGWVLLNWPVVQVLGAVVYPVFMLGALLAVVLLIGGLLAHHLFCPAVASEGADWLDSYQRATAYVVATPMRLMGFTLLGVVQGAVVTLLVRVIGSWAVWMARWAATAWTSTRGPEDAPSIGSGAADGIIAMWEDVPLLLTGGAVVSLYFTTSTIIYLLLREHNDGQDPADLWMEGMVGGTLAAVQGATPSEFDDQEEG